MTHAYEIVGYVYEGDCYCPDCFKKDEPVDSREEPSPMFACDEHDQLPHCATCHEEIDVVLIIPEPQSFIDVEKEGDMLTVTYSSVVHVHKKQVDEIKRILRLNDDAMDFVNEIVDEKTQDGSYECDCTEQNIKHY